MRTLDEGFLEPALEGGLDVLPSAFEAGLALALEEGLTFALDAGFPLVSGALAGSSFDGGSSAASESDLG
jgi:hypothetical protein